MDHKSDEGEDMKLCGFLTSPRYGGKWSVAKSDGFMSREEATDE
jgi:hypothetical protein